MQERSLKIARADTSFIGKISLTINKILIPTKISLNSLIIAIKRNQVVRLYDAMKNNKNEELKKEYEQKYEKAYEQYLDTLDKYVMDTIYKKVKSNSATQYERDSVIKYSQIIALKEKEPDEYKYKKQKYLLDLDYYQVNNNSKEKLKPEYKAFYLYKVDELYKSLLKSYAIKIANIYDVVKNQAIFDNVFNTLESYYKNYLPIKIEDNAKLLEEIPEFALYEKLSIGKLDQKDLLEKKLVCLLIARNLFTHSMPLAVVEKCYNLILIQTRQLLQDTKIVVKKENTYNLILTLIEDYKIKLLRHKVYWESPEAKKEHKDFLKKYEDLTNLKDEDIVEYIKQKEILFLRFELKDLSQEKILDYTNLIKYYRRKLIDFGQIKEIKNACKTGNFVFVKKGKIVN